jgi:serine/threonine-protein kinase
MEYLVHHLEHTPPSPLELKPELPPALAKLVLKLLEKAPAARPSVEEVRASLQEILDGLPLEPGARPSREMRSIMVAGTEARPAPRQERPEVRAAPPGAPPRSRTRLVVGVATGVLLLASGVAVLLLRSPAPKPVAAPPIVPVTQTPAEPTPEPPPVVESTPPSPPPAEAPAHATGPSKVSTERKPNPLLTRITRLEGKLRSLPADEQENARRLLNTARDKAKRASTVEDRKKVRHNLDIWERQYLKN